MGHVVPRGKDAWWLTKQIKQKMLSTILGSTRFAIGTQRSDTDFVDNLHTLITSNMLIAFALLSSFKMFGGRPVECMVPDDFTSSWEEVCS
uniref:Innexin n=1 Tax=Plectus sambesii TaxID=2011161 RepID=A0A914XI62_9BILA